MSSPALSKSRTVYRRSSGPSPHTLVPHTEPLPLPLPPTFLPVAIHAISLNYRDANMLRGGNPWPILDQGIPCSDAAGVCSIVDQEAITGREQGRSWSAADVEGVLASQYVVDEQLVVRVPRYLEWAEASVLPNAGVTAWSALVTGTGEGRRLLAGQTIVVTGTRGVSMMALKFALAAGCKVIVTSSSDEKLKQLERNFGKTDEGRLHTLTYRSNTHWPEAVHDLNNGVGADILLENAGAAGTLQALCAVKRGGTISQVGYRCDQDVMHLEGLVPLLIDRTVT